MTTSLTIEINIRVAKIKLRKDNVIELKFKNDFLLDAEDVYEIYKAVKELCYGSNKILIVITGDRNGSTREARKLTMAMSSDNSFLSAEAVVINSLPTRIAANFFYKIYKPKHPNKIFKTQDEAEKWVLQFK